MRILTMNTNINASVLKNVYSYNIITDSDFDGSIEYYTIYRIELFFFFKCLHPILLLSTLKQFLIG